MAQKECQNSTCRAGRKNSSTRKILNIQNKSTNGVRDVSQSALCAETSSSLKARFVNPKACFDEHCTETQDFRGNDWWSRVLGAHRVHGRQNGMDQAHLASPATGVPTGALRFGCKAPPKAPLVGAVSVTSVTSVACWSSNSGVKSNARRQPRENKLCCNCTACQVSASLAA